MIEGSRPRVLDTLNTRYLYGRVPVLHAIVLFLELLIMSRLIAKFNSYYAEKPVLTTMITNAILGGMADTIAQTLTIIRIRSRRLNQPQKDTSISDGIEMSSYPDEKSPYATEFMIPLRPAPPPAFDFERLTRFMSYGFVISAPQHEWFRFLTHAFPYGKSNQTVTALQKVALDQLIFAPVGLACFFTFMTVTEGGGRRAVVRKFQDVYLRALKANFMLWPLVQFLNFRVLPMQYQAPFVSTIGIAWTAYLSITNSADEPL